MYTLVSSTAAVATTRAPVSKDHKLSLRFLCSFGTAALELELELTELELKLTELELELEERLVNELLEERLANELLEIETWLEDDDLDVLVRELDGDLLPPPPPQAKRRELNNVKPIRESDFIKTPCV